MCYMYMCYNSKLRAKRHCAYLFDGFRRADGWVVLEVAEAPQAAVIVRADRQIRLGYIKRPKRCICICYRIDRRCYMAMLYGTYLLDRM
jgi:hypothetical protein